MDMELENQIEEVETTPEETVEQLKTFEGDILDAILGSASYASEEIHNMRVIRNKKIMFQFRIRPLSEEEYTAARKKNTKYVRNKNVGVKVAEETNMVRYRSQLLYMATVPEDRAKVWDNKEAWEKLNVASGVDLIDKVLMAGEKDAILEQLDRISGYQDAIEVTVKN